MIEIGTALEVALQRADRIIGIPPMTDPLGQDWEQPKRSEINLSGNYALMSQEAYKKLLRYDTSTPTGLYEGKMWCWNPREKPFLCWIERHPIDPKLCLIKSREIIILV